MKSYKRSSLKAKNAVLNRNPNSALANFPDINGTANVQHLNKNLYIVDSISRTTYLRGQFLGKGGFARVYELTDLTTGQVFAGKIIPKTRINKTHYKNKLESEINLHRNLDHLHVVRFYHCFEDDENLIIILENCPNKSLMQLMIHRKTLTEPEVRFYLRQLVFGLRYIHANQIVHRDLKPANMLLSESMTVKICDFGLADRLIPESQVIVCGTPNYMAPEVINHQGLGYEVDLWAMGCIMYAMLVGQPPFETWSVKETYSRISLNMYIIPPCISRPARSLICQLLAPNPQHRPTLDQVLKHDFFISGYIPASLPASCCYEPPNFNLVSAKFDCDAADQQSSNQAKLIDSLLPGPYQSKDEVKPNDGEDSNEKRIIEDIPAQMFCHPSFDEDSLIEILYECVDLAPNSQTNPPPVPYNPLFISKWVDYSTKYGFGFQLSDRSVGVQFNDNTQMNFSGDRTHLQFQDCFGKISSCNINALPSCTHFLKKFKILRYITDYMEQNLIEGCNNQICPPAGSGDPLFVQIKRAVRITDGIAMQLTNGTLQVNFSKDHSKIVLSTESSPSGPISRVTYINSDRLATTYRLLHIAEQGCQPRLRRRLLCAYDVLRGFDELDRGQSDSDPTVHKRKRDDDIPDDD